MPTSPSFPPLVHGLWRLAVSGQIQQQNSEVGQPLSGVLPPLESDAVPMVLPPGGQQQPLTVNEKDAGHWTFDDTQRSGVYTVSIPGDSSGPQKFAVNVDSREGNLARIVPEDLPRAFLQAAPTHSGTATTTLAPPQRFPLHQVLLCLVLGVLLTESVVAWWLGNRAR
jgi:hypothetical protein